MNTPPLAVFALAALWCIALFWLPLGIVLLWVTG